MLRRLVVAVSCAAAAGTVLSACASVGNGDSLQVTDTLVAALPAVSPQQRLAPAGAVLTLAAPAMAVAVDEHSRTLAIARSEPAAVLLYALDDLQSPPRTVTLPGPARQLDIADGSLLVPVRTTGVVLRIALPGGQTQQVKVDGGPTGAAVVRTDHGDRTVIALRDGKGVAVLDGDRVERTITGFEGAVTVLPFGNRAAVLDELRSAVISVDLTSGQVGAGLRAGDGATNAVRDRFGRVLVTDTRGGELLAFSASPLIMRQRYPVPGAPYGLAYDAKRDLLWVTLTERNEVVGFSVAGGEPVERYRYPTVRQPNAVAVAATSGRVVVVSGTGGGIQVMQP